MFRNSAASGASRNTRNVLKVMFQTPEFDAVRRVQPPLTLGTMAISDSGVTGSRKRRDLAES